MTVNFFRKLVQVALLATLAAGVTASGRAFADATIPTVDIDGAADSQLLKRYEGSFIVSYEKFAFTDFVVPLSPLEKSADENARDQNNNRVYAPAKQIELEGALTRIVYVLPEQRSPLEVLRNYQDVIAQAGGEIVFECKKEACGGDPERSTSGGGASMSLMQFFLYDSQLKDQLYSNGYCTLTADIGDQRYFSARLPRANGDAYTTVHTYSLIEDRPGCKTLNGRTVALVHVLEPTGREQKMVVIDAGTMARSLTEQGSISLYGILFDFDKADLKPESRPALDEIAKLLKTDSGLGIVVVGHTDNKGSFDYNINLSSRRALSVKNELISSYDISPERLTAAGAGMMAPVASNDTEEGRAKNRRVELVKRN
jgi:outer membrane protein OmpA-like peptidoglycan-associated protein